MTGHRRGAEDARVPRTGRARSAKRVGGGPCSRTTAARPSGTGSARCEVVAALDHGNSSRYRVSAGRRGAPGGESTRLKRARARHELRGPTCRTSCYGQRHRARGKLSPATTRPPVVDIVRVMRESRMIDNAAELEAAALGWLEFDTSRTFPPGPCECSRLSSVATGCRSLEAARVPTAGDVQMAVVHVVRHRMSSSLTKFTKLPVPWTRRLGQAQRDGLGAGRRRRREMMESDDSERYEVAAPEPASSGGARSRRRRDATSRIDPAGMRWKDMKLRRRCGTSAVAGGAAAFVNTRRNVTPISTPARLREGGAPAR